MSDEVFQSVWLSPEGDLILLEQTQSGSSLIMHESVKFRCPKYVDDWFEFLEKRNFELLGEL